MTNIKWNAMGKVIAIQNGDFFIANAVSQKKIDLLHQKEDGKLRNSIRGNF